MTTPTKTGTPPGLHPRNKHQDRYDFPALVLAFPDLAKFVVGNPSGDSTIDFANPEAVRLLNTALLKAQYGIEHWSVPPQYLVPPIPGRADLLHHMADLLAEGAKGKKGKIPTGPKVRCLDIGTGANLIYPILGVKEYGWTFVGTDIEPAAIASAAAICQQNPDLGSNISLRLQANPRNIFEGILQAGEHFDLSICNPPFHASAEAAEKASLRKVRNLKGRSEKKAVLNFGGKSNELWCHGGERGFISSMIVQSKAVSGSIGWFSSLVSNEDNLEPLEKQLHQVAAKEVRIINMWHGNKKSRILAWRF